MCRVNIDVSKILFAESFGNNDTTGATDSVFGGIWNNETCCASVSLGVVIIEAWVVTELIGINETCCASVSLGVVIIEAWVVTDLIGNNETI